MSPTYGHVTKLILKSEFRLACDHLFGKLLFTWLSLVMSMMVSFVLSFFPRDVLDEILNLIESVSEDFPSYSSNTKEIYKRKNTNSLQNLVVFLAGTDSENKVI